MSSDRRVTLQPAFILHRKPYRDTSLLLEVFSRDHGRIGLVARGAQGKRSTLKALLQPFQPLLLSWSGRGELQTLTAAEADGVLLQLNGEALLSGFYLNEILMRLLHRHDPHSQLYVSYRHTLVKLGEGGEHDWSLRLFECDLLQQLGYGLQLTQTTDGEPLDASRCYCYNLDHGPTPIQDERPDCLHVHGSTLLSLGSGMDNGTECRSEAKRLMRAVLQPYLGNRPLASRELFRAQYGLGKPKNIETDKE
jgi:DNA repair protein RecO (recombination protein O)